MAIGTGIAVAAGVGALGGLGSALIGSNAATTAAGEQTQAEGNALALQNQIYQQGVTNETPFVQSGQQALSSLMSGEASGAFSMPASAAPTFTAPTLAQAQQTPGYQFTQQQGSKGILEGAGATGGAISGGTLKSLDQYNQNLATTNYSNIFNQALSTYGANLSTYQAQQAAKQQQYAQLMGTAGLGQGAAASEAGIGASTGNTMAQLMASIGSSQAAGTVGSANAITSGLTSGVNNATQTYLLNQLLGTGSLGNLSSGMNPVGSGYNSQMSSILQGMMTNAPGITNTFDAGNAIDDSNIP